MRCETSYGIVPLRQTDGQWEVLIIRHKMGKHYGFPKGHPIKGERPEESATRELKEETGLVVKDLLIDIPFTETYFFFASGEKIHKTVTYFAAEVSGSLQLQAEEVSEALWVLLSEASSILSFPQAKKICQEVQARLTEL